ncbi:hypothetical protein KGI01_17230 [Kurthia gibsonii]|nr:hypothetical protein KGI01_17230 [Kurthia gibsonii]
MINFEEKLWYILEVGRKRAIHNPPMYIKKANLNAFIFVTPHFRLLTYYPSFIENNRLISGKGANR